MKKHLIILVFLTIASLSRSQNNITLQAKVVDCKNNLPISGANLLLSADGDKLSIFSDNTGLFSLSGLHTGQYSLSISYLYAQIHRDSFYVKSDTTLIICLTEDTLLTDRIAKSDREVVYYLIGLPQFTEYELNNASKQYNLKWILWGCDANPAVEQKNTYTDKILAKRIGGNWKELIFNKIQRE